MIDLIERIFSQIDLEKNSIKNQMVEPNLPMTMSQQRTLYKWWSWSTGA